MKTKLAVMLGLMILCLEADAQTILKAGDVYSYQFDHSLLLYPSKLKGIPNSSVRLHYSTTNSSQFLIELFEDTVGAGVVATYTNANSEPVVESPVRVDAPTHWEDLQGAIRITMLSGSITIDDLVILVPLADFDFPLPDVYFGVPIPDAATPPKLRISDVPSLGKLFVSWPFNTEGYVLEYAESPLAPNWVPVPLPSPDWIIPALPGQGLLVDFTNRATFFRLRKP